MKITRVYAIYYSATGTTKKVVTAVAGKLAERLSLPLEEYDFTLPEAREKRPDLSAEDLVIFGSPTYAGRLPNKMLDYISSVRGNNTLLVPVVLYGNRAFDDSLMELSLVLSGNGFLPVAAAAFVGEHAMSHRLAKGRPDAEDMKTAEEFAEKLADKLNVCHDSVHLTQPDIPGRNPVGGYYHPLGEDGSPAVFLKARPVTSDACDQCGLCAKICPMGSIDRKDASVITGICIKCGACIKQCPKQAKSFDDSALLSHVAFLEKNYLSVYRKPQVFL